MTTDPRDDLLADAARLLKESNDCKPRDFSATQSWLSRYEAHRKATVDSPPCGGVHATGALCGFKAGHTQWHSGKTSNGSRVSWWSRELDADAIAAREGSGKP